MTWFFKSVFRLAQITAPDIYPMRLNLYSQGVPSLTLVQFQGVEIVKLRGILESISTDGVLNSTAWWKYI